MSASTSRLPLIDALKAAASQLIVLHHLAFYGPMSDTAYGLAPALFDWLYQEARIAVQVFLVIGGFLAARSLSPQGQSPTERPLVLVWNRYRRLAVPLLAAIGLAIASAAIARLWMRLESIPAAPTAPQLLAHALLLQNLLGYESLSAGVWYVAIDFQLFALTVGLLWLVRPITPVAGGYRHLAPALVSLLTLASLLHFNRDAAWDNWALYFFGAYGLGALAFWASRRESAMLWLGTIAAIGLAALLLDFRSRIAVALLVALLIGAAWHVRTAWQWLDSRPLAFLGGISYSVFLVHYPVCLLVNAAFTALAPGSPLGNAFGLMIAWGASILAGALFHRHVEKPAGARQGHRAASRLAGNTGEAR
jgi:peptidoglycan/LPS O-acetylase OafA/YrhL